MRQKPTLFSLVTANLLFWNVSCLNGAFFSSWSDYRHMHNSNNHKTSHAYHYNAQQDQKQVKLRRNQRHQITQRSLSLGNMLSTDFTTSIQNSPWMPLYLSCLAGASTCLGAAISFCKQNGIGPNSMSFSLSLAASVMITISVVSLGPECLRDPSIGHDEPFQLVPLWSFVFLERIGSFGVGCLLYRLLSYFAFPEPEALVAEAFQSNHEANGEKGIDTSTHGDGGDTKLHVLKMDTSSLQQDRHQQSPSKQRQERSMRSRKSSLLSTASNSTHESSDSLDEEQVGAETMQQTKPLLGRTTDMEDSYDKSPPSPPSSMSLSTWSSGNDLQTPQQRRAWRVAMLLFVSLLIHNFPEGLAVAASSVQSTKLGLAVTFGIMIHNIPEGIAIAIPCLAARPHQPWLAFLLASGSGLAEPLGAAIALLVLRNSSQVLPMENVLAFVAGIMVMVACWELIPEARRHESARFFWSGILVGIVVMVATELYLPS